MFVNYRRGGTTVEGVEAGSQTQLPPVEPATRDAFSGGVNIETWSKYQTLLAFVFLLILRISLSLSLFLRVCVGSWTFVFFLGFWISIFFLLRYIYIRFRRSYEHWILEFVI